MLHVRLIAPPESTPQVLQLLEASSAVTHLCVNEQSARKPAGDVVSFDVAREGATTVLEALKGFGLEQKGAIVVENLDISISESAIRAEEETPGEPADAVVWEQLEQSAGEETRLSITYLCFMIEATMIAGIGVMLDQDEHGMPTHSSACIRCDRVDGFPCLVNGKADAQTICVEPALEQPNVTLLTDAYVSRVETGPSGRFVERVGRLAAARAT